MKDGDVDLLNKLHDFYKEFISNGTEREAFIREILDFEKSNVPRRMINSVERLVTLSDDIEKIRKRRESIKVFFLVVCIETLYYLRCEFYNSKMKKTDMIIDFFTQFINKDDKNQINANMEVIIDEETMKFLDIDMENFALIINGIRNIFAHEGNYWSFSFANDDTPIMNSVKSSIRKDGAKFELGVSMGLKYSEFRRICATGFINFINDFFTSIK